MFISIDNDGFDGTVDRLTNITGVFDSNGIGLGTIDDLENPSFTVALVSSMVATTIAIGDDLDENNDGNIVLPDGLTVLDAIGVSDILGDDASLYGEILGGSNVLFNGQFDPLTVFRDGVTGDLFQMVTVDFGDPTQRIGVFAASGGAEISPSSFSPDATATTFGAANPTLVPEPSSALLVAFADIGMILRRRK